MHIADFSVKNSVLVNFVMGAIIIMGFLFTLSLPGVSGLSGSGS